MGPPPARVPTTAGHFLQPPAWDHGLFRRPRTGTHRAAPRWRVGGFTSKGSGRERKAVFYRTLCPQHASRRTLDRGRASPRPACSPPGPGWFRVLTRAAAERASARLAGPPARVLFLSSWNHTRIQLGSWVLRPARPCRPPPLPVPTGPSKWTPPMAAL